MQLTVGQSADVTDQTDQSIRDHRSFNWQWIALLGAVITVAVLYFALAQPIQVLPLLDPAPAFELTDHRGESFRSFAREERTTLYAFAASRDSAYFPELIEFMRRAQDALAAEGWDQRVDIAIMTVDPNYDNAGVLDEMRTTLGLAPDEILFLTGPRIAMKLVIGTGFGVYYEDPQPTGDGLAFTYDQQLILVDGDGILRARYDMGRLQIDRLIRDLGLLFTEQEADGMAQLAYSAAHFFLCFPR